MGAMGVTGTALRAHGAFLQNAFVHQEVMRSQNPLTPSTNVLDLGE